MDTRKLALIAILTSLAVGTNYALAGVPNVKLMDTIVFMGGLILGPAYGAAIGILCWSIYGPLNPYGFQASIWFATMFCETFYGIAGGLFHKIIKKSAFEGSVNKLSLSILFIVTAVFSTLSYDLITTIAGAAFYYSESTSLIIVLISGIPFYIAHVVSNAVFFGLSPVPVMKIISKVWRGGERNVNIKK